jgi:AraC-like DNA-binding protein
MIVEPYQVLAPPPELEDFVDCFWDLTGAAPCDPTEPEIVLPDGKTELIVHFGEDFFKLENGEYVRQARVLMSGQLTERIFLRPSGKVGVVSVRFKPAGAARFFDIPFCEIVDRVIDFSQFEKDVAQKLVRDVADASTPFERIGVLRNLLLERLSKHESNEDIFVRRACRYITQSEGSYSVQELVKLIGFSERQLERKFKKQVGITPKHLSRIVRFQKFITLSKTSHSLTLTDVSQSCGYYDQSHFIKDFTKFSGVSPLSYLNSAHPMSDHFTSPAPK